ncbi:ABC transporter ATP-binding protein [Aestuariivirga litoralis]|uniref:ABC transporter ATP-binding protein n=1 Tax=Aestuariivirga litoralis TaxID=2650924 RepID=UPI0018C458FA|nr:ABC transporter ATP-binding protein [Aestuariivirga litoralis]MBG1233261.1 ABC transporter ATP-binding protein [Aestuariivirga litoralis]
MPEVLLAIDDLKAAYGGAKALHGVSFSVAKGETLALIGANGAGKSTLLKSICGLVADTQGHISFKGEDISRLPGNEIVKRGIALVPEGRRLFPSLSVEENLVLGGKVARNGEWNLAAIYGLFPILKEKRHQPSTSLSGGQQQMVAIGRALMSNPELLLLDELSLGLAPIVIKDIYDLLPRITGGGLSAILVEQDVTRALNSASRFLCLQEGHVSLAGEPAAHSREAITRAYFGT